MNNFNFNKQPTSLSKNFGISLNNIFSSFNEIISSIPNTSPKNLTRDILDYIIQSHPTSKSKLKSNLFHIFSYQKKYFDFNSQIYNKNKNFSIKLKKFYKSLKNFYKYFYKIFNSLKSLDPIFNSLYPSNDSDLPWIFFYSYSEIDNLDSIINIFENNFFDTLEISKLLKQSKSNLSLDDYFNQVVIYNLNNIFYK